MLRTKLCDLLGIEIPIMSAGMRGIATKELVAAIANAGGFGTYGSSFDIKNTRLEELLNELLEIKHMCNAKPFGLDVMLQDIEARTIEQFVEICAKGGAKAFVSGEGCPSKIVIDTFHQQNMIVGSIARELSQALHATETGVDFVIVQGYEGGGHTGEIGISVLLPQVVDAIGEKVPVVAAGGIYDGRGLAASLVYGAQGVWVGTRFIMTPEAKADPQYKQRLLEASSDDTIITKAYSGTNLRVLRNPYVAKYEMNPRLLEAEPSEIAKRATDDGCWKLYLGEDSEYDDSIQALLVGQNVGAINNIIPVRDIVKTMHQDALQILNDLPHRMMASDTGRNRLCEILGIKYPIMLAGMGGIASKELVAAVTSAGGFGTWGSAIDVANKGPEELLEEVRDMKRLCGGLPFGVDILVHGAGEGGVMKQLIQVFSQGGAKAFISGKGFPRPQVIKMFHEKNMMVGSIAGKLSHAVRAVESGVDFVIVQGYEGGGHTGEIALSVLLPQVVDAVGHRVPVVAAGGIFDGRGLAAALAMGASGVWVGTRFMLTTEAKTHIKYKERLLKASSDDTTVTKAFTGARLRVLKNPYVEKYHQNPDLLESNSAAIAKRAWDDGCWKLHGGDATDYDDNVQAYVTGQNIGAIDNLESATAIVDKMMSTAIQTSSQLVQRARI